MKKSLLYSVLSLSLIFPTISNAQCGFDVIRNKQLQNPAFEIQEQVNELRIKNFVNNVSLTGKAGTVYTIPVVVHVLHKGEAVGSGTNISDAQIQSGIDRLNEVYRGLDPNSPIDFEIEFALAQRDPDCNATTGINRVLATGVAGYSASGVFMESAGADETELKDLSKWPETDYCNIWIVSEIDNNGGGSGIQGYANFFNGSSYEGSVMMYTVFGYDPGNTNGWGLNSNGDGGTIVHEFGHYFHLYHTFQGDDADPGPGYTAQCPGDAVVGTDSDGCSDTEIHKRLTSTCPANNDCLGNNPYGLDTKNNYMSYFSCTDRLTNNQKTRVTAAMSGTSIVASKGGIAPDPSYAAPVAVCNTNTVTTNNAGITSVELNGTTFTSFSSSSDGGNIDKSANCSGYFEIDASVSNTINVGMYTVNFQQLGVWIDWNDDGDFNDDSEQQHLSEDIAASSTVPIIINYPTSIPYDDYVRIRLITDLDNRYGPGTINSSCYGSIVYGQSEDYAIYVQPAAGVAPVADFSGTPTTLCAGNTVVFTDLSTNIPTSWSWTFTGGTPSSSSAQNPTITYNTAGTYQVQLTATNASGNDVETKIGYITVNPLPGNAGAITGSTSECENATGVAYSISSVSGATGYNWTVPSGATVASGQNTTSITVDFGVTSGNVSVTPTNSCGNGGQASKAVTIAPCGSAPVTNFSTNTTTICTGESVNFTDLSTNTPTSWSWDFGDGGSSSSQNTTYTYNTAGTYSVTLTATNASGSDDEVKTNLITVNNCTLGTGPNIKATDCNRTFVSKGDYASCMGVVDATQYEFKLADIISGIPVTTLVRTKNYFNFYQITGWSYGTTYNLSARAFVNGNWTDYGTACPITTPSLPTPTMTDGSCGKTITSKAQYLYCNGVGGATQYEYQLVDGGGNQVATLLRTKTYFNFYQITGWAWGTTYNVSARAYINGTWSAYGPSCLVTMSLSARLFEGETARLLSNNEEDVVIEQPTTLLIYPNPNSGEQLNVNLENLIPNSILTITDIYGKVILTKLLNTDQSEYKVNVKFDNKLVSGFYFINIVSDGNRITEKLIVR